MSLGLALTNALSGLKVSQQSIAVISQNLANANNPDYIRQQVTQSSVSIGNAIGSGVQIEEISRVVDDFINKTIVTRSSTVEGYKTIQSFYDQLQPFLGSPGNDTSIDSYVTEFFGALNDLATTGSSVLRQNAVNKGNDLAVAVSSLARNVEGLRFQADQEIGQAVDDVNFHLTKIQQLNRAVLNAKTLGGSVNSFLDQIDVSLSEISKNLDISYRFSNDGTVNISTAAGQPLLENERYELTYSPSSSVDQIIAGAEFTDVTAYRVNGDGSTDDTPAYTLIAGGVSADVSTNVAAGKIRGLLDIRDSLFPDVLEQLNNFASVITDEINAVHNDGVSVPASTKLTGTTLIDPTDTAAWTGSVRIAVLNSSGEPVDAPWDGQASGYEPLLLDLASLNDGSGAGEPSFQAIIDEINEHFGVPQNRASIGNLNNVELVSTSDSLTTGSGTFNFTLETTNLSNDNAVFRITAASVNNGATVTVPASFPSSDATVAAGTKGLVSDDINFTLDMSTGTTSPYTVTVTYEVDDPAGGAASTGTMSYIVTAAASGIRNQRYAATSVTGSAALETPNMTTSFLKAKLVDASGNEVAKDSTTGDYTESGYLVLESSSSSYRIAIAEMSSANTDTGRGFSHYFGLNNFFVDNGESDGTNAAVDMKVRSDILANTSKISTARLQQSRTTGSNTLYTYEVSNGDTSAIVDIANLSLSAFSFSAAGGLPDVSVTFSSYTAQILGYISNEASNAIDTARTQEIILNGFKERKDAISGVNIDEELANTIIFQNAYAANARMINTTKELFDTLLQAF